MKTKNLFLSIILVLIGLISCSKDEPYSPIKQFDTTISYLTSAKWEYAQNSDRFYHVLIFTKENTVIIQNYSIKAILEETFKYNLKGNMLYLTDEIGNNYYVSIQQERNNITLVNSIIIGSENSPKILLSGYFTRK